MKPEHLDGMVRRLGGGVADLAAARRALAGYWQERAAIVWTTGQVHRAANEQRRALTPAEARQLLQQLVTRFDPFAGVSWFTLADLVGQSGLGRPLTAAELNRLLEHDHLTVAKPR